MSESIDGQWNYKLATIYIAQNYFQKIGKDQYEYETVDGLLELESVAFSNCGDVWVIEMLTKIKVTVVGYDADNMK